MEFEWDEDKNRENIRKHDLDFADAWQIFDAPMLIEIDNREDYGEERFIGIGLLKNFIVVVVFTESEKDIIRVISLRKALKYERERFEKAIRDELG
ncbi:MAG TPA: BrnT family toxin [Pyrinomonadaceae bacterium]|nr:BrnT family toxin [Pyrinomonadaceae bacterium]